MNPWIDVFIVALLPLAALFTVVQTQPYFALISRGILGVVAVMLFAVMGAADVALTEALVGTLLTVILYAITVRSTRVLRVGRLPGQVELRDESPIRHCCSRYKLALRKITFNSEPELVAALQEGRVDAVLIKPVMLSSFMPNLPLDMAFDQEITLLAEHGRWHERAMRELVQNQELVMRLTRATEASE